MSPAEKERVKTLLSLVHKAQIVGDSHLKRLCKVLKKELRIPVLVDAELRYLCKQVEDRLIKYHPTLASRMDSPLTNRDGEIAVIPKQVGKRTPTKT